MADLYLANTLGDDLKPGRLYDAVVKSRDDILNKGRLEVKIPELLGEDDTIFVQALLPYGKLKIIAIPPIDQEVKVFFNGTIDEGYWLGGNIENDVIKDPDELLIADDRGNFISWHRNTGELKIKSLAAISIESNSQITFKAPTINLDGEVITKNGASGLITNLNMAVANNGLITQID